MEVCCEIPHQHALAPDAPAAPKHEAVLRLLDELRLDVLQVLGAVVAHEGKVGLEELLVRVEPGGGDAGVLALAGEEVDEVHQDAGGHQDLEVVVLPGIDESGRPFVESILFCG